MRPAQLRAGIRPSRYDICRAGRVGTHGERVARGRRAQTKWGPTSLPTPTIRLLIPRTPPRFIPVRRSEDLQPAKRCAATHARAIRRRFGRPPFGGRPHLKSPSSSRPCLCRNSCSFKAMDCFSVPDRVRFNSWESLRSVTRISIDFLVNSARYLLASLATTLHVPATFRLCRPMI